MIRQKHLVLTLEHCFKMKILINYMVIISIFFIEISKINAQEKTIEKKPTANLESILPIAVIDMQKVLSKSTAWASLQKEMQTLEKSFKDEIKTEEDKLKKEQEKLLAQKSVVTDDQFKEKEKSFKAKVNKVQSKVENLSDNNGYFAIVIHRDDRVQARQSCKVEVIILSHYMLIKLKII